MHESRNQWKTQKGLLNQDTHANWRDHFISVYAYFMKLVKKDTWSATSFPGVFSAEERKGGKTVITAIAHRLVLDRPGSLSLINRIVTGL